MSLRKFWIFSHFLEIFIIFPFPKTSNKYPWLLLGVPSPSSEFLDVLCAFSHEFLQFIAGNAIFGRFTRIDCSFSMNWRRFIGNEIAATPGSVDVEWKLRDRCAGFCTEIEGSVDLESDPGGIFLDLDPVPGAFWDWATCRIGFSHGSQKFLD